MQVIATTKIYNIASMNRSCLADEGLLSQLSFQTFSISRLYNSIIKMSSFIRAIIMRKLMSRFFLCSSIFLCSEIFSLPNALAMNVGYVIETTSKKKSTLIKQLKDFVHNIMLADTSSNNIFVNPKYIGSTQSRNNYLDTNKTASKALRVKNMQSHGHVNPLFFSTASPLLKHYNCYKSISDRATGSSKSIQRKNRYNKINKGVANFHGLSCQFTDLDYIDDDDSGIEDIFEDNNPLNAIPIPVFSRKST